MKQPSGNEVTVLGRATEAIVVFLLNADEPMVVTVYVVPEYVTVLGTVTDAVEDGAFVYVAVPSSRRLYPAPSIVVDTVAPSEDGTVAIIRTKASTASAIILDSLTFIVSLFHPWPEHSSCFYRPVGLWYHP